MGRRASRLILPLLLSLTLLAGQTPLAQEPLDIGALGIWVGAGYDGFALPVANPALARAWAKGSGLDWQAAYNYSVIPVRLDIEHRQARALRGRIEVSSEYGYAVEESRQPYQTVVSREFLVPPSVPTSLVLLPRACPPPVSGGTVKLSVSVYLQDNPAPWFQQQVEVLQLEPAHLYSLLLGVPGSVDLDLINADNHLALESPPGPTGDDQLFPPEMLASRHYTIACNRRDVTLAPLAARDFAFVLADAADVATWPEAEQRGLLAFVIGGGHLCLFNGGGAWQGLDLTGGALAVGRGNLLPVAGDYTAARAAVTGWLEGELTEFVVWCNGTSAGWQPPNLTGMASLTAQAPALRKNNPPWVQTKETLARRAGYLHPVWIYRETCRLAALEPWDYPEFNTVAAITAQSNPNLTALLRTTDQRLRPLPHCTVEKRQWPAALGWLVVLLPLAVFLGATPARQRWWLALLALGVLGGGGAMWWRVEPQSIPPLTVGLTDVEQGQSVAVRRELTVAYPDQGGRIDLPVAAAALVRRVSGPGRDAWRLAQTAAGDRWSESGIEDYITLATSAAVDCDLPPVRVTSRRLAENRLRLTVDTSGLPAGRECYLLSALGCCVLPGGQSATIVELEIPVLGATPGRDRLLALEDYLQPRHSSEPRTISPQEIQTPQLLRHLAAAPGGNRSPTAAERLCWLGLGQNPTGLRGSAGGQGVILAPLPGQPAGDTAGESLEFLRLTFPLEGRP